MSKESIGILADAKVKACLDELSEKLGKTKTSIISELILNHHDRVFSNTAEYDSYDGKLHHFKIAIRDEYYQYLLDGLFQDDLDSYGVAEYVGEWLECHAFDKHERKSKLRSVA